MEVTSTGPLRPSEQLATTSGCFTNGTVKRKTVNMYDTHAATFKALPDGPYESPEVKDQPTAQEHFNATREIKLVDRMKSDYPLASYTDHYPPKELPAPYEALHVPEGQVPFTSTTEYNDQYHDKPRKDRPVEPRTYTHVMRPFITLGTTNQDTYKPFTVEVDPNAPFSRTARPAAAPPANPVDFSTTYRTQYVPKAAPGRVPQGKADPRAPMPWLAGPTTYQAEYVPKELALRPVFDGVGDTGTLPFDGVTEYQAQYVPKEGYPVLPPLTGIISKDGLQLPLPRRSLGVEFWHKGVTDKYFMLIPRTTDVPCAARQVFTTVNDNQEQACILVLYGDDPVASNNLLLGQFDIVNIPPAPKDVPRIEVIFRLDRDMFLTAEARDLDTHRHKLWEQRAEQIRVIRA